MTEEEKIDNKMVAEFMSYTILQNDVKTLTNNIDKMLEKDIPPYNNSYSDVMLIVEKIESLDGGEYMFEICGSRAEISVMINHNWPIDKLTISLCNSIDSKTKLESIYKCCVKFIKQYNGKKV